MKLIRIFLLAYLLFGFTSSSTFAYNDSLLPQIQRGEPGEHQGEIIIPVTIEEVAAWCDFDKTILLTNRGYLCVFNGKPTP